MGLYATDAKVSKGVKIVATFPQNSYKPADYPIAVLKDKNTTDTKDFLNYLDSAEAKKVLVSYGFSIK